MDNSEELFQNWMAMTQSTDVAQQEGINHAQSVGQKWYMYSQFILY